MSFKHIASKYPRDRDFPARTQKLSLLKSLLDGSFYDILPYHFHEERNGAQEYIPLAERQPAVHVGSNLLRTVVNDSIGMLFGEGRFPVLESQNAECRDILHELIKEADLVRVMRDAAFRGSVGSIAIQMRILSHRVFFDVFDTPFLTPEWKADEPDVLIAMVERYKVMGEVLAARGYAISEEDLGKKFWFQRVWDQNREIWFTPWLVEREDWGQEPHIPQEDPKRSVVHNLGFCPWVWIRNLHGGCDIDGSSTFGPGIETAVQIDYQMSQAGRALRYAADPLLVIKEPPLENVFGLSGMDETPVMGQGDQTGMVRSPATALTISSDKGGDAKFLEIDGSGAQTVIDYCDKLRDQILEAIQGNRSKPDAINSHQGAKALEILNAPLIRLTDNLRASYGEYGLLRLLKLFLKAVSVRGAMIRVNGKPVDPAMGRVDDLSLRWGAWFAMNGEELMQQAMGLAAAISAGIISRETATKVIAREYDIEDIAAERALIAAEQAIEDQRQITLAAVSKTVSTPNGQSK